MGERRNKERGHGAGDVSSSVRARALRCCDQPRRRADVPDFVGQEPEPVRGWQGGEKGSVPHAGECGTLP